MAKIDHGKHHMARGWNESIMDSCREMFLQCLGYVASLLLVAMPGAPSSFLLLIAMHLAPSSVLVDMCEQLRVAKCLSTTLSVSCDAQEFCLCLMRHCPTKRLHGYASICFEQLTPSTQPGRPEPTSNGLALCRRALQTSGTC